MSDRLETVPGMLPSPWYQAGQGLLLKARTEWKGITAFGVVGATVATATVLLLPSYWRARAAFQAEPTPATTPFAGALAGLASQVGGLQLATQGNALLFGDLLKSEVVLRRVARGSYPWKGQNTTLATVYRYGATPAPDRDFRTVRRLRKAMDVDVNTRTGVVTFSVEGRTPELALALAESTLAALNESNVALRQTRASAERTFTAQRAEDARQELASAEAALADFSSRNRAIENSPALRLEESRLRRAVDMAQQLYVQLRLLEEQAAVQEVRNTPAISVVDPPILPVRRSWPRRRAGVLAGLLAGLALGVMRSALRR